MKKRLIVTTITIILILISFVKETYSDTTTRGLLTLNDDGSTQAVENDDIVVKETITNLETKELTFKVEVENHQDQGTEVALVLDNSFSMWSQEKINAYKQIMISVVDRTYEKIPDVYMSLSCYNGTILAMTENKQDVVQAISNITNYSGIASTTGLNYAKNSFTGKAKNKHIIVFTDTENSTEATTAINEVQADSTLYMTAVIMGENSTKQTEYKQKTHTKVYMIEDTTTYDFDALNTNIVNWVYSSIEKEMNNSIINGFFTNSAKDLFYIQIQTQTNIGQLLLTDDGFKLTMPQIKNQKASFYLKMTLKDEIDSSYINQISKIIEKTTITYDDKRQENKTLEDTEVTPSVAIAEHYTLELTVKNKEFQGLKPEGIKCTIVQKALDGTVVNNFGGREFATDEDGKIIINDLTYEGASTFEISFNLTDRPYEEKASVNIEIYKNETTSALTVTNSTLDSIQGEQVRVDTISQTIKAEVTLIPKAVVFNVTKTDEETGELLKNVPFTLEQPETNDIPENSIMSGTTNESGNVLISGEVAGIGGTYTYKLKETATPTGYIEAGETLVSVQFDDEGKIESAHMSSEGQPQEELNVENNRIDLNIKNKKQFYTLKIHAIDGEYNQISVEGIEFEVKGVKEDGTAIVPTKRGTTNSQGELDIEINYIGKVTYTITQINTHPAYNNASDVQYVLTRVFETNDISLENEVSNISLDNEEKLVTATIPLTPKKFELKVNKKDAEQNTAVEGVTLELTQPGSRNKLTATSLSDGVISLTPNIVCDIGGGTSTYYIKETQKALGYKQISGSIAIEITFDENGNITGVSEESEYVENVITANKKVEMDLLNEQQEYTIEVNMLHKGHDEIPIQNAQIEIMGNVETSGTIGEQFYQSGPLTTDSSGYVTTGNIKRANNIYYTIKTNSIPKGYKMPENKTIEVNKNLETESISIVENNNENLEVEIDNANKIIKITLYLEATTFTLQIDKEAISLENTLIGKAVFQVEQPNIKYKDKNNQEKTTSRERVTGETVSDQSLELLLENPITGDITDRTFYYTLTETSAPKGYVDSQFELTFALTFNDNGTLTSISDITETSNTITRGDTTQSKDDITEATEKIEYLKNKKIEDNKLTLTILNKQQDATLKVQALNGKYKGYNVPVDGTKINVKLKDNDGIEFYNKDLITDENGYIEIDGISQKGEYSIELNAIETKAGYLPGASKTIYVNRDILSTEITITPENDENRISGKTILTKFYIDVQTFDIEITKLEEELGTTLIEGATFTITQEKIVGNERQKPNGTTVKDEKLIIKAEVIGEGTYEYKIKETVPNGYIDNSIDTTLKVTFDSEGKITNVDWGEDATTIANKEYITLGNYTEGTMPLTIMNNQKPYKVAVRAYKGGNGGKSKVGIPGVEFNIKGNYEATEIYNENKTTDASGIVLTEEFSQRGDADFIIQQINVPENYIINSELINVKINKDRVTTEITLREEVTNSNVEIEIDNSEKIIYVNVYIQEKGKEEPKPEPSPGPGAEVNYEKHKLMIKAKNEEDESITIENVHVKVIGRDAKGNRIPIATDDEGNELMELIGITDRSGIVEFSDLIGSGDIYYEIIQEEPRPVAFYLGANKIIHIYKDAQTGAVSTDETDEVKVQRITKEETSEDYILVSTDIYLTPKKFTITLNKIDYDTKELIGGATIIYTDSKWGKNSMGVTQQGEQYIITGYVAGEGTYTYGVSEGYIRGRYTTVGIPAGYKKYINQHSIDITFDENGDIINAEITNSSWRKIYYADERKQEVSYQEYTDLKYHTMKMLGEPEENNINLELTNVKRQFEFDMHAYNSKYTSESVAHVNFRIIAKDENGNEIYNKIQQTDDDGKIKIADEDYFRVTGEITFTIEALNLPSKFEEMPIATVVINRAQHPQQTITVDNEHTSSFVEASAEPIKDRYDLEDFTYVVNVEVPLKQKEFDMDLTKVSSFDNSILLKGATFTLTQPDETHSVSAISDENGKLTLSADLYGENTEYMYVLTETGAPNGYRENNETVKIYVTVEDMTIKSIRTEGGGDFIKELQLVEEKSIQLTVVNTPEPGEPFNVKIIEKVRGEPVEGTKFSVNINSSTGTEENVIDYTDENGTIEILRIPGSGEIIVKFKELEDANGYRLISEEKTAVVYKLGDSMEVDEGRTSQDISVAVDEETNTIIIVIDHTEEIPTIKNLLEFEAVDIDDESIKIEGVGLSILPPNATEVLNETTDENGLVTLNIKDFEEGEYKFNTTVINVPDTYFEFLDLIKNAITINSEGNIQDNQKIEETETNDRIEVEYEVITEENGSVTYKAKVKIKLIAKSKINVQVVLNEKDNEERKIEGAIYDIKAVVNTAFTTTTTKETDEEGTIALEQAAGEKIVIYLQESKTTTPYILDDIIKKLSLVMNDAGEYEIDTEDSTEGLSAEILEDGTVRIKVENELKGADINFQLLKLDNENEAIRLSGVVLKLLDKTTNTEYEITTDESGQIELTGFKITEPGEYEFVIKEMSTLEGYELPQLAEGEEIKLIVVYEEVDGFLAFKEVKQEGGENVITGLSATQISTDKEYILQIKLVIQNEINDDYKYTVNLYKRDMDTLELLPGAKIKFATTYGNGNSISAELETDENGIASLDIPIISGDNNIEIQEIEAPEGYKLDETTMNIVLSRNSIGEVGLTSVNNINIDNISYDNEAIDIYIDNENENPELKYALELTKVDEEDNTKTLGGAKYKIEVQEVNGGYNETFEDIETAIENGIAYLTGLRGNGEITITITETEAPEWYALDTETKVITLIRNAYTNDIVIQEVTGENITAEIEAETVKVLLTDTKLKFDMNIYKTDGTTDMPLEDVEFTLAQVIDGNVTDEKIEVTTDENGEINFEAFVQRAGEYIYELEEKEFDEYDPVGKIRVKIVLNEDGTLESIEKENSNAYVEETIEDGIAILRITNMPIGTSNKLEIEKVDSEDEEIKLKGATFDIVGEEYTTDENGYIEKLMQLPDGGGSIEYTISEKVAPEGYIIHNEEIKLKINYDTDGTITGGKIIQGSEFVEVTEYTGNSIKIKVKNEKLKVENEKLKVGLNIYKTNGKTNAPLEGVEFTIAEVINGEASEAKASIITDENGAIELSILAGEAGEHIYELEEKELEGYEAIGKIRVKVVLNENGTLEIAEQEGTNPYATVSLEDGIAILRVINIPIENPEPENPECDYILEIYKIDKNTGEELKGVEFTITEIDEYTNVEKSEGTTAITNENGRAYLMITGAEANKEYTYRIKEKTPNGYNNVEAMKIKVCIGENGTLSQVIALEENSAIRNIGIETEDICGENRQVAKIIIQNEKTYTAPEEPDDPEQPIDEEPEGTTEQIINEKPSDTGSTEQNKNSEKSVIQKAISSLPYTGKINILGGLILVAITSTCVAYIKYREGR